MNLNTKIALIALTAICSTEAAFAADLNFSEYSKCCGTDLQNVVTCSEDSDNKPALKFTPAGRILMDGALFAPDKEGFSDGVAIHDVRLGGTATYDKFAVSINVGYVMNKFRLMDTYFSYKPDNHNTIKLGYFINQFGLNAASSSSLKPTMIVPISDTFFNATGYNIGLNYIYSKDAFLFGVSAFASPNNVIKTAGEQGKISVGGMERFVWRPLRRTGEIVQVGFSSWYQGAEHNAGTNDDGDIYTSPGFFDYSCNFPTKVDNVTLLKANINQAKGVLKISPELILSKDRFAFEGQYYFMNVDRRHGYNSYKAQGAYGLLRALILGEKSYSYSSSLAGVANPQSKTLECVLGYDYTNASDCKADIMGGISNDYSLTFNYYLNKYLTFRLRYSYTTVRHSEYTPDRHENIIQARVMFLF